MPLQWKHGESPYRLNYFAILGIGPAATYGQITAKARDLVRKVQHGTPHLVAGREVTEAEINEAESRLLDERHWAEESLLVHPSSVESVRLPQICSEVARAATPAPGIRLPELANPAALGPFIPGLCAEDVGWPEWEKLGIAGCDSPEDRACDIQFDL